MTTTTIKNASTSEVAGLTPMKVPFSEIHEPGAWVSNTTGHLLRIPEDGVKPDRTPVMDLVSDQPLMFSRVSVNPYISLTKARMLACDLDLPVNF